MGIPARGGYRKYAGAPSIGKGRGRNHAIYFIPEDWEFVLVQAGHGDGKASSVIRRALALLRDHVDRAPPGAPPELNA